MIRRVGEDKSNYTKRINLIRLMKERNIDHEKLAELYKLKGENTSYIYQLTGGIHPIGIRTLRKLARVLQVSEDEFHRPVAEETERIYDEIKHDLRELAEAFKNQSQATQDEIISHLKRQISLLKRVK